MENLCSKLASYIAKHSENMENMKYINMVWKAWSACYFHL